MEGSFRTAGAGYRLAARIAPAPCLRRSSRYGCVILSGCHREVAAAGRQVPVNEGRGAAGGRRALPSIEAGMDHDLPRHSPASGWRPRSRRSSQRMLLPLLARSLWRGWASPSSHGPRGGAQPVAVLRATGRAVQHRELDGPTVCEMLQVSPGGDTAQPCDPGDI
jgi:hypothetical protein